MTAIAALSPIQPADLSGAVTGRLRELILSGALKPATPLTERALSERLDVSRTPVREALATLQGEGLVATRGRRGLQVAPVSVRLMREIYPLIAALERLAVESAPPDHATLAQLDAINAKLRTTRRRSERMKLDRAWHDTLLRSFENNEAKTILGTLKQHAERTEALYFGKLNAADHSCDEHARITALLRAGKTAAAAKSLRDHWCDCLETLVAILGEPPAES